MILTKSYDEVRRLTAGPAPGKALIRAENRQLPEMTT